MKIGIEIPYVDGARGSLIYTLQLIAALANQGASVTAFSYFWRDHAARKAKLRAQLPSCVKLVCPRWPQAAVRLDFLRLNAYLVRERIDVFHDMSGHRVSMPSVFTMFGTGLSLNGTHPYFDKTLAPFLPSYSRIVVMSDLVRDFLIKYYPAARGKIAFAPTGVDHDVFNLIPEPGMESVPNNKFILCVGPFSFKDNAEHLLTAYARMPGSLPLVLMAGNFEENGAIVRQVAAGIPRVSVIGSVPYRNMAGWYKSAIALVHPSYYEESGMVFRDAMACGLPIIAAAGSGNEEVLEDVAEYFNPHYIGSLQGVLERVLKDSALRRRMSLGGIARTECLSWTDTAVSMLDIYHAAARK